MIEHPTISPREYIERLLFEYCASIDRGDFEGTGKLFGATGLYGLVGGAAASGSTQVTAMMRASVRTYDGVPRTRHVVTNVVIDVSEDGLSGTVRSYVQVLHQAPGGPLVPIVAGTYYDRVHTVGGEWEFAERRMHIELTGDLSTHLVNSPL